VCEDNVITLLSGWWFDEEVLERKGVQLTGDTEIFACLNEFACVTDVKNVSVSCSTGYSGALCGACDLEGQGFMRSGQLCRRCDSYIYNIIFVSGMAAVAVVYILYVIAFQDFSSSENDQRPVVIKIAMSFCQMLTVLGVFKARGTAMFNEIVQRPASIVGGGVSSALPLKCLLNSQIYGAFLLNMLTPLLACGVTALLIGPVWIGKRVYEAMRGSRPPRKAPREKFLVLCCRWEKMEPWETDMWMLRQKSKDVGRFHPGPRFVAVLVFVLFGVYPTLVKSIFSIFRCSEPIGGVRYLEDDFTVQCWVGWHPRFVGFASLFGLLYLFGIPLSLFLILQGNRHRLAEPRFMSTFGFVYNGYHTDRGLIVAWESFVMLRKLAVTAITVSSSDPYIQIFVALLLLIISYGMQERMQPFETSLLNTIEGVGLFSLIFTQIISILYLYIDSRAALTGKKNKMLEYIVTVVLLLANIIICASMVFAYILAWNQHRQITNRSFKKFIAARDEPFGPLTKHRNPRITPPIQFEVFTTLEDCDVYLLPLLSSEKTGETAERGDKVVVSSSQVEYVRARCGRGREVAWLEFADGTGWILDCDLRSGDSVVRLTGHRDDDGTMERVFWRVSIISEVPLAIRAGTSGPPFVWPTGEFVAPGESVLVDRRFIRKTGAWRCSSKESTYLHLADRRGWIVEPSRVPDTDWLTAPPDDYVDVSVAARLVGQEKHNAELRRLGVSEYKSLDDELTIYEKDVWPLSPAVGSLKTGTTFLVEDRTLLFTRLRFAYISILGIEKTLCFPRSFRFWRRVGRFAQFLKLSDGRGYVLIHRRSDAEPLCRFKAFKENSVTKKNGLSLVRWNYQSNNQVTVHATIGAAAAAVSGVEQHHDETFQHIRPLAAGSTVVISSRQSLKAKTKDHKKIRVTVGAIESPGNPEGSNGWVLLNPNPNLELRGVSLARSAPEERRRLRKLREAASVAAGGMTRSEKRKSRRLQRAAKEKTMLDSTDNPMHKAKRNDDAGHVSVTVLSEDAMVEMENPMKPKRRSAHARKSALRRAAKKARNIKLAVGRGAEEEEEGALPDMENPMKPTRSAAGALPDTENPMKPRRSSSAARKSASRRSRRAAKKVVAGGNAAPSVEGAVPSMVNPMSSGAVMPTYVEERQAKRASRRAMRATRDAGEEASVAVAPLPTGESDSYSEY